MRRTAVLAGTLAAIVATGVVLFDTAQPSVAQRKADPPAVHATSSPTPSASPSPSGEQAPHCVHVTITDASGAGPVLFTIWCGTGSGGQSPMEGGVRQLTVDGTYLRAADCTKTNPCVILWPASPQQ